MPASSFRERGPPELGCSCGRAARSREIVHDELAKLTDRARVLLRTSTEAWLRCTILEHELGLAQDNHQRGQTRGNDVTAKSGQESFQVWLARHAQGFIDATSWEEFHGIADAHGVRLDLRANGFVFTHQRSLIRVKASSISRHLAKTALEARLGTFIASDYQQGREAGVVREEASVWAR